MVWTSTLLLGAPADVPTFDVKQFGAVGDGRTDDQQALQAASDAASRVPAAIVYIPRGVYLHSQVIDFSSNTTLEGTGPESVLLAATPAASAIRFADAGNCAIRKIKVSSPAPRRLLNDTAAAILLANSHNCTVSSVVVDGAAAAGINVHDSRDMLIDNVEVWNTRADGIHVVSGSKRITVSNNTAEDTGDDSFSAVAYDTDEQTEFVTFANNVSVRSKARGVTCIGADDCVIRGNKIYEPAAHGIAVAWESSYHTWHPHRSHVENNLIRDVLTPGMNPLLIDEASDVEAAFNRIEHSNPVYLHGSTNVAFHDMQLENSSGTALIARDCTQLSITSTSVKGARDSGFVLENIIGGELARNNLIDVQSQGDSALGAIDIRNSRDLSGSGNRVQHSETWNGATHGPLRVIASSRVEIAVEPVERSR
jgi:polygalacturonase